jgi:photosystem II stability/assembly factor-like uncharacterized protein
LAIAFDARSPFGVAVGEGGYVWSTADEGATWRARRSGDERFVEVAVVGTMTLLRAAGGPTLLARDGGFALETLATDPGATWERGDEEIVVRAGSESIRVMRSRQVWRR